MRDGLPAKGLTNACLELGCFGVLGCLGLYEAEEVCIRTFEALVCTRPGTPKRKARVLSHWPQRHSVNNNLLLKSDLLNPKP